MDHAGFQRLYEDVVAGTSPEGDDVRGPGRQVTAILLTARELGYTFEAAWKKAIRTLEPSSRDANADFLASVTEERQALLGELRPFARALYEGRPLGPRDLARVERLNAARLPELADLAA